MSEKKTSTGWMATLAMFAFVAVMCLTDGIATSLQHPLAVGGLLLFALLGLTGVAGLLRRSEQPRL